MTALQIYKQAISLMNEDQSKCSELERFIVPFVNQIMLDCFEANNSVLASKDQDIIEKAPIIESINDKIVYDDMLVRECFPYGLAALLCVDDDRNKFNLFNFDYSNRLSKYTKVQYVDMEVD